MINLDKPRDADIHTLADFAELLCLITHDRICDRETLSDHLHDIGDMHLSDDQLNDCYSQLAWRKNAFEEFYPFTLDLGERSLQAIENFTYKHEAYVLILLCANLPFIEARQKIADYFEKLSLNALSEFWPKNGEATPFGKNNTVFKGTKAERINHLASLIGADGRCRENTLRPGDSGDGGIDLAAWATLDSFERRNIFSGLAQCACSRTDWPLKQTSITATRLTNMLMSSAPWVEMLFIPHCFRDNNGRWAVEGEVAGVVVFDRLRILLNINLPDNWKEADPPPVLEDFLNFRMSLV